MIANTETRPFQAETQQLLQIVVHSLYTNKEIFLRELISNASDALDRLRFESLTKPELLKSDEPFEIRLEADRAAKTLTISDTGIGMSRAEVIANIGTIAKSGVRELRELLNTNPSQNTSAEFIGQFGVGFYSAFMVADKVVLTTRRAGEQQATRWESTGDGQYSLSHVDRHAHGTSITLHLKPFDSNQDAIEDFTDPWVLARIVKRYSDFVAYPIICKDQLTEAEPDAYGALHTPAQTTIVVEDKILNSMKPIWTRPQSEVADDDYAEFYRHITPDKSAPLKTIALKAEGRLDYHAVLFIPATAPYDLFYHAAEAGLRLYAKRVMVMEQCKDLLPDYLRFIKGVVDSSDLPLNISRQMLQQERHLIQIRKRITKKILDALEEMYHTDHELYLQFWKQFGRALKEGVNSDYENKDRVVSLLLFESSWDAQKLTSLKDYVSRMKEDQQEIFFLTGASRSVVEHSPHLEALRKSGYEVLYLVDPVDELLAQSLAEFEGKRLKSIGKGLVKLGNEQEQAQVEQELQEREANCAELLGFLQNYLHHHIKRARLSNRLTESPVCLVNDEQDYSPQLERLLQHGKGAAPRQRRILELNPQHPIFLKLHERYGVNKADTKLGNYAELLLGYALLAEGSELPNPIHFNHLISDLIEQTL
jgi:molecular chaperone HtpG